MTVFICSVNSLYYDDKLCHVEKVFATEELALEWKVAYETGVMENFGLTLPKITEGTDKELDEFNKISKSKKFISCEIKPFPVLRTL